MNNFNKFMKENLNEATTHKAYDYYQTMYSYNRDKAKEPEEVVSLDDKKAAEREIEKENEKLEAEIQRYLDKAADIQGDYDKLDATINETLSELEIDLDYETDPSKKKELEKKIARLTEKLKSYKRTCEQKLRLLNSKLSVKAKKELRDREELVTEIDDLNESITFKDLAIIEEKLIFGETLENINDVLLLERADPLKVKKDAVSSLNKVIASSAASPYEKNQAKMRATSVISQADKTANDDINARAANKDPLSGEKSLKENTTVVDNQLKTLKAQKENEMEKKEANSEQATKKNMVIDKKLDSLEKREDMLQNKKQIISSTKSGNGISSASTDSLTEAMDATDHKNNAIDFNNFSATLFNGASGNALRFLLKGEINNSNITDIDVAKSMQNKPDVEVVLKKLRHYLRKTSSGLTYEEYIDLKVLKGKFRTLFTEAKKEYMNRFKK